MISSDPIVLSFAIFGAFVGVFFVIDGWRGSAKPGELRNSPRMRALLWAIGFAVSAFILDLKKFGVSLPDDRSALFEAYLAGFAVAVVAALGLSILVLWSLSIVSSRRDGTTSFNRGGSSSISVMDYIHYGYEYCKSERDKALQDSVAAELEGRKEFLDNYADALAVAVTTVNHFRLTGGDGATVARLVLNRIVSLMEKYLGVSKINANYMHAYKAEECPKAVWNRLRFAFGDRSNYSHILALTQYASDMEREDFALPVERDTVEGNLRLLPGASKAFCKRRMVYIPDTSAIKHPGGLKPAEVQEHKAYLSSKSFKSFLCVPILNAAGEPVGVLNLDADRKRAFGQTEEEAVPISTIALPFCALLSAIIAKGESDEHRSPR